ncbi:transcriptional regulator NrdR [Candidatus Woesearchaeota archaeon]|nr:transcriptional regulator NrdR [Candidatus Woesearchaeota archaeon]MBW3018176.1 transcriptional regulator NrdR [Candidatus Woesearchaeota archaeon]
MKCPYCNTTESKVIDKRATPNFDSTRRRRECLSCSKRYTTYERVENIDLTIIKKDGKREQYDRDKVRKGLLKACEKRPVTLDQIDEMIDKIETKIKNMKDTEVPSKVIGEEAMKALMQLDKVAYIRFASVYREFTDVNTFVEEINRLLKK